MGLPHMPLIIRREYSAFNSAPTTPIKRFTTTRRTTTDESEARSSSSSSSSSRHHGDARASPHLAEARHHHRCAAPVGTNNVPQQCNQCDLRVPLMHQRAWQKCVQHQQLDQLHSSSFYAQSAADQ